MMARSQKANQFWIVVLYFLSLVCFSDCIPGTITPLDPILLVGSDVIIKCKLNTTMTSQDASEMIWYKNSQVIDTQLIDVTSSSEAQISVYNLTQADNSVTYSCSLPGDTRLNWLGTVLQVGSAPTAPTLECFSSNIVDYWCEWSKVENTGLVVNYTFQFEYRPYDHKWKNCPKYTAENRCQVPLAIDGNPGVEHGVKIIVHNDLGTAVTESTFWPEVAAVPVPPKIDNVESAQTSLTINWVLQENLNIYLPDYYQIRYSSTTSNWTENDPVNAMSTTIDGLGYYTQYNLQVRSRFRYFNSWSVWSSTYVARTSESAPEGAVKFEVKLPSSIDNNHRDILFLWETFPQAKANGIILGYNIYVYAYTSNFVLGGTTPKYNWTAAADERSHTIYSQTRYERLYVTVTAFNSVGETRRNIIQIQDESELPSKPLIKEAETLSWNMIRVTWTAPVDPGGVILLYELQCSRDDLPGVTTTYTYTPDVNKQLVMYTVKNLTAYTTYRFNVRAKNKLGFSVWSDGIQKPTYESVPGIISDLIVKATVNPNALRITWSAPEKTNGLIANYYVYYKQYSTECSLSDCTSFVMTNSTQTTYALMNLQAYSEYEVWMTAVTGEGEGVASHRLNQTTSQGAPDVPQSVTVHNVTSTSFSIQWEEPAKKNGIIDHYIVRYWSLGTEVVLPKVTNLSVVFGNLYGDTVYVASVASCNHGFADVVCGKASTNHSVLTNIGVAGRPRFLTTTQLTYSEIRLQWDPPEHPNGPIHYYNVSYSSSNGKLVTLKVDKTLVDISLSCNGLDNINYTYQVQAVNVAEDGSILLGQPSHCSYQCISQGPDIILIVLVPCVLVLMGVLGVCIYKQKYHKLYFTEWPEPNIKHIDINLDLCPAPIEREKFDEVKKESHRQSSHGSSASSDQGFHEMMCSVSQIELNTTEQTAHLLVPSDLPTDMDDETFYSEVNTAKCVSTIREECNSVTTPLLEDMIEYRRLVHRGSKETLDLSPLQGDFKSIRNHSYNLGTCQPIVPYNQVPMGQSKTHEGLYDACTEYDPCYRSHPSETYSDMYRLSDDSDPYLVMNNCKVEEECFQNCSESKLSINRQPCLLINSENDRFLSDDYVTSNNFRGIQQRPDTSTEDISSSHITDYSQMELEQNISAYIDNIVATTDGPTV